MYYEMHWAYAMNGNVYACVFVYVRMFSMNFNCRDGYKIWINASPEQEVEVVLHYKPLRMIKYSRQFIVWLLGLLYRWTFWFHDILNRERVLLNSEKKTIMIMTCTLQNTMSKLNFVTKFNCRECILL